VASNDINIHTKFRENLSLASKFEMRRYTDSMVIL
jgi:hypothetical protein